MSDAIRAQLGEDVNRAILAKQAYDRFLEIVERYWPDHPGYTLGQLWPLLTPEDQKEAAEWLRIDRALSPAERR
jgi:hypothetical protein